MALENRTTEDLARIAHAGGGFRLKAGNRTTDDLARIAQSASTGGARIVFCGLDNRTIDDLARIAAAGKGTIAFDD